MERIRCPHCNAVNQDVEPTDSCWQCGKPLSAAAAPASATESPNVAEAQTPQIVVTPSQAQQAPVSNSLEERVAARKAARKTTSPAAPILVIALIVLVLIVLFFVLRH